MKREKQNKLFDNEFLSVEYVYTFRQIIRVFACMTTIDGVYLVVIVRRNIDGFIR